MAMGDAFLTNQPINPAVKVPTGVPATAPVVPTVQPPGVSFANPDVSGLQLANVLGMLAQAYGQQTGTGGQVGGAISQLAQQGIAGKAVGSLAEQQQEQAKLTPPDQEGPTTETMKRNADGTYTRTITGLDTAAKGTPTAQPGTAFGAPVQRPFEQPTPQTAPVFEGLGGLPIAAQMQLLEQQRAGQTAQQATQAQAFEQAAQLRKEALDPVVTQRTGADGKQYNVRRSGAIEPLGIGTYVPPTKQQLYTMPSGPMGEKTTIMADPVTGEFKVVGTGTPQPTRTGVMTEAQAAEGAIKLQRERRAASMTRNKKGKIIPSEVSSSDISAFNTTAKAYNLPYRFTKIKVNYDPLGRGDYRKGIMFQTDAEGNFTATDIYNQLVQDYQLSEKHAKAYVRQMIKQHQGK